MLSPEGAAELLKKMKYSEINLRNRFRKSLSRKSYLKKKNAESLIFLDKV